jgi:hypothetical protein
MALQLEALTPMMRRQLLALGRLAIALAQPRSPPPLPPSPGGAPHVSRAESRLLLSLLPTLALACGLPLRKRGGPIGRSWVAGDSGDSGGQSYGQVHPYTFAK